MEKTFIKSDYNEIKYLDSTTNYIRNTAGVEITLKLFTYYLF